MNQVQINYTNAKTLYDTTNKQFIDGKHHDALTERNMGLFELRQNLWDAEKELLEWSKYWLNDKSMDVIFEECEFCPVTSEDTCKILVNILTPQHLGV